HASFFSLCSDYPPVLHPFPTRRSSDLAGPGPTPTPNGTTGASTFGTDLKSPVLTSIVVAPADDSAVGTDSKQWPAPPSAIVSNRSEEHTSELQSQSNLVCRLLLEKKKK